MIVSPFVFGVGGVAVAISCLSREFSSRGWQVIHLTKGNSVVPRRSREEREFLTITANFRIPYGSWKSFFAYIATFPINACYLAGLLYARSVKGVLIQYPIPGYFVIAVVCKLLSIPCCVTFQGSDAHQLSSLGDTESRLVRRLLSLAHETSAVSRSLARKIASFDRIVREDDIHIIPNGTPLTASHGQREIPTCKKLTVCGVGKLIPRKGFDILIAAIDLLCQSGVEVDCKIIGDGPQHDELQAMIAERKLANSVSLTGNMDHERVLGELAHADVFVLSSRAEGAALVLVEAMSCGCAIIATNVDGALDTITDRQNGLLVEVESPEQIARALVELNSNMELRDSLSRNARATASGYSWSKIASQYLAMLGDAVRVER